MVLVEETDPIKVEVDVLLLEKQVKVLIVDKYKW
jgi:hypothetical protein